MEPAVRPCELPDLSAVAEHVTGCLRQSYEFVPCPAERLAERLSDGSLRILLAEMGGTLVGSVGTVCSRWGEELEWLAVPPSEVGLHAEEALRVALEAQPRAERLVYRVTAGTNDVDPWAARGYVPDGSCFTPSRCCPTPRCRSQHWLAQG